ncbi:MAG: hypothetical protein K8S98_16060 [Planctomycetes bacterium]|nr:hypothetical protein [Planctomycetota bacterium]
MSPFRTKSWCERCETCDEVTPHSSRHFHVVQVLWIALLAAGVWAYVSGADSVLVGVCLAPAFVLWVADCRRHSRVACERCRWKREKADEPARLNPASTTTIIDLT